MPAKKTIVISAINIHNGGMLTILRDCLSNLKNFDKNIRIIALVHRRDLVPMEGVSFIELNKSRGSWLRRLFYEYYYFNKISKRLKPFLWLSLHDISPNVTATRRAVYCHNASSFYKVRLWQIWLDPRFLVYNLFYDFLYKKNIKKNNFIIVQQGWIRDRFHRMFGTSTAKTIVAYPSLMAPELNKLTQNSNQTIFFYPSFPRIFKNFETIMEASKFLIKKTDKPYKIQVTINGEENKYARWLKKKYGEDAHIDFIGAQSKTEVNSLYQQSTCLIFPSELETWGLPLSEAKAFDKPILAADLPYAHETVRVYEKASFFPSRDAEKLSDLMLGIIDQNLKYDKTPPLSPLPPYAQNWSELFTILLT